MAPAPAGVNPSAPTIIPTAAETGGFSFVAAGTHSAAPACSNVGPVPPESRPDNIFGAFDGSALMAIGGLVGSCASTADSVAATASSTTTLKLLVDSGSSGHYIDNASMPGAVSYTHLTLPTNREV